MGFRVSSTYMDISNGVKLTNTVYKLLEFFLESDPLKNRAKDKALAIMENLVLVNEANGWMSFHKEKIKQQILEDIDVLLSYLWVAKQQGWISSVNYLIIANEYEKIKKEFAPSLDFPPQPPCEEELAAEQEYFQAEPAIIPSEQGLGGEPHQGNTITARQNSPAGELTARQRKIIEFLSINEKAQVMDLQKVLSNVTKRTIRRDLDELLKTGKVVRFGDFNQIYYRAKLES